MSDSNVHVDTHPSGHPNKTAVNAENPIFGRPADPVVTEVSIEQAALVQSDKAGRETVVSPLINEAQVESPAVDDDPTGDKAYGSGPEQPAEEVASVQSTGPTTEAPQDSEPVVGEPATEAVEEAPVESDPVVTEAEPASAEA